MHFNIGAVPFAIGVALLSFLVWRQRISLTIYAERVSHRPSVDEAERIKRARVVLLFPIVGSLIVLITLFGDFR